MKKFVPFAAACCIVLIQGSVGFGQGRTITRVFWQDDSTATVRYGDLKRVAEGWSIEPMSIAGFPSLDVSEQSLVQMHSDAGVVLLGVRDQADGEIGSGWIAIDSGAQEESHGDHSHWRLNEAPSVLKAIISTDQGNPAHVYKYDETFVLANDKKNGFTTTTTSQLRSAKTARDAATFYAGGNGHITLAVVANQVAYATWIAREGDERGRVDVVKLGAQEDASYAIHCPSGVLHGATANSGRVFFAPSDGVCWVDADLECDDIPETVQVHHLSLGKGEDDLPLRTGAFENLDQRVLFTAGKGEHAKLCWIDASSDSPSVQSMAIELSAGESLTTPKAIKTRGGKSWVLMFRENAENPESDALVVVDVDGNSDGVWNDSAIHSEIALGRSQIEGHSGHHELALLPTKRHLLVSNPGDGTIALISTADFAVAATFSVGGTPTRLAAIGD